MSRIPEQFIDELLNRVDVVEVIDSRVKLRKTGKNYSACCPFHKEKTPSFSVSPDKQFYYCFGCGASGTAISFLMDYEHLGFLDAIESLAAQAGLAVPKERDQPKQKSNKNLYTILEKSQQYYQDQLKQHPKRQEAVTYLQGRGLTGQIAKKFSVGYAPIGWDNLITKLGVSDEDRKLLEDSGMVTVNEDTAKRYDRFRHRIMFPIIDVRGRTIAFGGRVLASESEPLNADGKKRGAGPKYLNSPETAVFHKSREFYGLYQALKAGRKLDNLLVVEGYMDVIALAQFGIDNAVATMGTACGEEHLKLGFRYTNQIVFCFDGDNAGRKAAKRALENALPAMLDGRQINFLFLPEGQDPDTLVRQIGAERFEEQLSVSVPLETFFFESVAEGIDIRTMEGRARMSKIAAPLLNTLPNGVFRELMFESLAQRTGLSFDVLQELIQDKVNLQAPGGGGAARKASVHEGGRKEEVGRQGADQAAPLMDEPPMVDEVFYSGHVQAVSGAYSDSLQDYTEGFESTGGQSRYQESRGLAAGKIKFNPARLATALLLDEPGLLSRGQVNIDLPDSSDEDVVRLRGLLEYLSGRPSAELYSILGFWAGHYGADEQKRLTELLALLLFGSSKNSSRYDSLAELKAAFDRIRRGNDFVACSKELTELMSFAELDEEQKRRYRELLQLQQSLKASH